MSEHDTTPEADALHQIATALQRLGTGNADTGGWGAIEAHTKTLETVGEQLATALGAVASALSEIADAIKTTKPD